MRALLRGPFADPRFRRLLAGQSLSSFGDTALYLTLGIWAKALTGSNAAAGGVFLALGIPALFAPVAGHLADRIRRRPLLIWGNALTAALVLSLLAVHSRSQLWIIYLVAFGYGVSFGVLGSGFAGLQKDLLPGADLAAANAALTSVSYGLRIVAPLAGAALFTAFGGSAVAVLDTGTFAVAIAVLATLRLTESEPEPAVPGSFRREFAAGVRHLRRVPLLAQITLVTACAFSIIGLNETIIFAVVGQGLHRPPSFFGVVSGVQGAGSVAAGIVLPVLLRRAGPARMVGLSLAWSALGSAALLSDSTTLVLAGSFADGAGLVWLVAVTGTAIQLHTPPRLQGRAKAAWTMLVITPQTVSIAVGAALISYLSYRVMLLAVVAVLAACAAAILIHPAPEPLAGATPEAVPEPARDTVLSGREAQGAVEADDLAVEVVVLGDALDHGRVLGRPARPPGVRDLRAPNNRWYSRRWLRPSKLPSGSARRSRQPRRLSHGSVIPQVELLVSKKENNPLKNAVRASEVHYWSSSGMLTLTASSRSRCS